MIFFRLKLHYLFCIEKMLNLVRNFQTMYLLK